VCDDKKQSKFANCMIKRKGMKESTTKTRRLVSLKGFSAQETPSLKFLIHSLNNKQQRLQGAWHLFEPTK